MTSRFPSPTACRFSLRTVCLVTLTSGVLLLQACSPKEADAASSAGQKSSVLIVRQTQPEFPDKAVAAYRELQQRCMDSRTLVAQAGGPPYDPAADAMTDAAVLALDTQKTEEFFDGSKYAVIVSGTQFDSTRFGVDAATSCKLVSSAFKSAEIRDTAGDCRSLSVEYDLAASTGTRTELKGACDKPTPPVVDQGGATATVAGQPCQWNTADASPMHIASCTLSPPVHAGTGQELVAVRKSPNLLRDAAQPLPGAKALTFQSAVTIDQASRIEIGGNIPASAFEAPADSANFPLTRAN